MFSSFDVQCIVQPEFLKSYQSAVDYHHNLFMTGVCIQVTGQAGSFSSSVQGPPGWDAWGMGCLGYELPGSGRGYCNL